MKKETKKAEVSNVAIKSEVKTVNTALQVIKKDEKPLADEADFKIIEDPKKQGLDLDETLRLVEDLHRKKRQRDNLEHTIDLLQDFVIDREEEDLDDKSYYTGCVIAIKDDNRREFTTKNPVIIGEVVKFLQDRFMSRLAEVEAQIVLPV